MIDVTGTEPEFEPALQSMQSMQQRNGIAPSGKPHNKSLGSRRMTAQACRHGITQQIRRLAVP
ncbi:MAG: hypothetical protein WC073_09805 [Sterolibacterium sp.]